MKISQVGAVEETGGGVMGVQQAGSGNARGGGPPQSGKSRGVMDRR